MFFARRHPDDALHAVLLTLAPALFAPVLTAEPLLDRGVSPWLLPAVAALGLAAPSVVAGVVGRLLGTLGLLLAGSAWVLAHLDFPGVGAVVLLGLVTLLAALWPAPDGGLLTELSPAPAAALSVLPLVGYGWSANLLGPCGEYGVCGAAVMAGLLAIRAAHSTQERQLAWGILLAPITWGLLRSGGVLGSGAFPLLAVAPIGLLSRAVPPARVLAPILRLGSELLVSSPPRLLVSAFAAASGLGTLALVLPVSDTAGQGLVLVDAAFLAVSSVTLTGLVTIEPAALSVFGKFTVLLLMQAGGLGMMTFASAAAEWTGARLGVRQETVSARVLGHGARQDLRIALRRVVIVGLVAEGVGALLLLPGLVLHGRGWGSVGESVFLAVSAFCNAGLTPWSGNLVPFARDPWILSVVTLLSLAGALGPSVLLALPAWARGEQVPMWIRLSLLANGVLVALPFPVILGLEWARSLAHLPAHDRVLAAALLTVSSRTAGFTSVALDAIEPATRTLLSLLMFVGSTSGSAGGGVKVTTVAVLVATTFAAIRGRRAPEFGHRQIPSRIVFEAVAIVSAGGAVVLMGVLLLQLTQALSFDLVLFDVVSAVSTCGLTTGAVGAVDGVGKIVLFACMFAGRVGPLTLFLLLSTGQEREVGTVVPSEEVPVG